MAISRRLEQIARFCPKDEEGGWAEANDAVKHCMPPSDICKLRAAQHHDYLH